MERDLAESRAHLAEISAANDALRRANADLEASRLALVQSEARLRIALEAARMATWDWNHVGNATRGSRNREAVYGAEPGSLRTLSDVLALVHPDDLPQAVQTVDRAFRRSSAETDCDAVEYRVVQRDGGVRWLRSQGRVISRDQRTGEARQATGVTFDITDRRLAEQAAARALAEVRAVYDTVPAGLALLDPDGRFVSLNARLTAIFGAQRATPGDALEDVLPAEAAVPLRAAHRRAVAEALVVTAAEIRFESPAASGDRRFLLASLQPILPEPGGGAGVLAVSLMVEDVTDRRRAEAKRDLLAREVDHRARNALAVVLAAVRMTRAEDVPAFARAVEGRIAAVARAQTLLADRQWSGAALRTLIEGSLAVFVPDGAAERVRLDGPDLTLDAVAVQPFCMAVHELATNATKHGAFARPDGRVAITWSVDSPAGALRLRWSETRGGPSLAGTPPRTGFGSRVIRATIRDQLGGKVEQHWKGTGLVCDVTLPLARVVPSPKPANGAGRDGERAAARGWRPRPDPRANAADAV